MTSYDYLRVKKPQASATGQLQEKHILPKHFFAELSTSTDRLTTSTTLTALRPKSGSARRKWCWRAVALVSGHFDKLLVVADAVLFRQANR